jgi:hypothetical protein
LRRFAWAKAQENTFDRHGGLGLRPKIKATQGMLAHAKRQALHPMQMFVSFSSDFASRAAWLTSEKDGVDSFAPDSHRLGRAAPIP